MSTRNRVTRLEERASPRAGHWLIGRLAELAGVAPEAVATVEPADLRAAIAARLDRRRREAEAGGAV